MNIDKILEFFYAKASARVAIRIEKAGIKYADIYEHDPKQISWIKNNNRTKNNRFLICDGVLDSYDRDSHFGLVPKLGFKNPQEVLWGTEEEIDVYLPQLFKLLWDEVTKPDSDYSIDKETYFCDYIPYAKWSTRWELLFSGNNHYPALQFGFTEDEVINNIDSAEEEAYHFLYLKCAKAFAEIFKQFSSSTNSFHKINKVFKNNFIDRLYIPMLNKFIPNESSLGLHVKNLQFTDLSKVPDMISEYQLTGHIDKIQQQLMHASSEYIVQLERIQKESIKQLSLSNR